MMENSIIAIVGAAASILLALIKAGVDKKRYEKKKIEVENKYKSGECRGDTAYCKARIIRKCIQEYLRIESILRTAAAESYILDLNIAESSGKISFIPGEKPFVIQKHKKILESSFMNGRYYMHDLIVEDDFPVSYIKQNGVDIINPNLIDLVHDVLDNYYAAVWDVYEYSCDTSTYKLDFHERRISYEKNKAMHRNVLLELMLKFNKLMGKERK